MSQKFNMLIVIILAVCMVSSARATMVTVFEDNFNDGNLDGWTNTGNVWTNPGTVANFPMQVYSPAGYYPLYTTFTSVQPLDGVFSFTGSFTFLNDTYEANQNSFRVGVLDEAGLNGYVIRRAFKRDDIYGPLRLLKVVNGVESVLAQLNPVVYAASGTWELSRSADGLITVRINRAASEQYDILTATDTTYNDFGQIALKEYYYSSGNPIGLQFDNIKFQINSVPEPATMCLLAAGGLAILARRRNA